MNFVGTQGHRSVAGEGALSRRGLQTWGPVLQALQGCESLQISPQELGGSMGAHCIIPVPLPRALLSCSSLLQLWSGMKGTVKGPP